MICPQCGALVEDAAEICENCGMTLTPEIKEERESAAQSPSFPVLREFDEDNMAKSAPPRDGNLFVKWVSVVCSVVCFVTFMMAATSVEPTGVASQMPSMFGSIFGGGQATLPAELARALNYAFTGMAFAFSGLILISGFKKK